MTPERLQEIRARTEKASKGPWSQTWNGKFGVKLWDAERHPIFQSVSGIEHSGISDVDRIPQWQKDCDFVRMAREDIPYLLGQLDALKAEKERLEEHNAYLSGEVSRQAEVLMQAGKEWGREKDRAEAAIKRRLKWGG